MPVIAMTALAGGMGRSQRAASLLLRNLYIFQDLEKAREKGDNSKITLAITSESGGNSLLGE